MKKKSPAASEIPPDFQPFVGKTPAQMLAEHFDKEKLERIAGLVAGLGLDLGLPIPNWAKASSKQLWKYYVGSSFDPMSSMEDAGVLARLLQNLTSQPPRESEPSWMTEFLKLADPLLSEWEKGVRAASPEETAQFYAGRAKGGDTIEKLDNPEHLKMVKLAPIYSTIAIQWRRFALFNNGGEAIRWLRAEKIAGENLSDRELYQVFKRIELPLASRGRPKSGKTDSRSKSKS